MSAQPGRPDSLEDARRMIQDVAEAAHQRALAPPNAAELAIQRARRQLQEALENVRRRFP